MSSRPEYLPERFAWYPGEPVRVPIGYREPHRLDARQMIRMVHRAGESLSAKRLNRILTCTEWPAYLAVRNARVAVGMVYGMASPAGTKIHFLYVDPAYRDMQIEARLAQLLALELPERPTTFSTRLSDDYHAKVFSGWKVSHADEAKDQVTYSRQYLK